ncbi:hypothetical protein QL285_026672 [Trifolium repens]|nr:hypothetical protein QL285_026672 [Trifolium repens]
MEISSLTYTYLTRGLKQRNGLDLIVPKNGLVEFFFFLGRESSFFLSPFLMFFLVRLPTSTSSFSFEAVTTTTGPPPPPKTIGLFGRDKQRRLQLTIMKLIQSILSLRVQDSKGQSIILWG